MNQTVKLFTSVFSGLVKHNEHETATSSDVDNDTISNADLVQGDDECLQGAIPVSKQCIKTLYSYKNVTSIL